MSALDLARWQFGITTVYHFLFVPLTIGLSMLVAIMQTAWVRTGQERYLRMTKFWGKLFLINFAMGVATGIVQEFQFGMNWSDYSRFVGDIFGAPLAIEGLLAFFLESTFLGLWIFGWDRLSKRVHLATIWLASIGTMLSAYFILAANSWMQHPVGTVVNDSANRAELKDFGAVLTNSTLLVTFPHTIFASFATAAAFVVGISAWQLWRHRSSGDGQREVFRPSMRLGLVTLLVASLGVVASGDLQARVMTEQQPMKMAAAEALYDTVAPASFSLFTVGSLDGSREVFSVRVPRVLSFMATGSFDGAVRGVNDVQRAEQAAYGPGDYRPNIPITYWTFRIMVGLGFLLGLLSLVGLWLFRRGRTPTGRWFYGCAVAAIAAPFLANSVAWTFTEMGRQPWAVYGMLRTADGVSPTVSAGSVLTSLVVFTVLYGVLAVVDAVLMVRYARAGAPPAAPGDADAEPEQARPPVFAY
ncbi:cytochrome ubiquinol oxidase subunit I [Pseudonocardia acaciae]|uniref:cytochrome ubiquinol oxidase subunit I n=1 Tax=Pseudonocardia acaciae TaxID=551276 RepID=UPI00048BB472|nr:cytochrome ubiquinol oxidase subunit I [Pseudonocardia acaciae]